MRRIFCAFFASIFLTTSASAEGSNPFWGAAEKLLFVTETQFEGKSGTHSLCVQATDHHRLFLPTHRTVGAYVFSQTNCKTNDFIPVPAARIPMLKAAGIIPDSIPDIPTAPLGRSHLNTAGITMLIIVFSGIGWFLRRPARKSSRKLSAISGDPLFFDVLLTVMFHTARTDGLIEKAELRSIMRIYEDLTGTPLTPDMAAAKFAQSVTEEAVVNLVRPYRDAQAEMLIDAAVRVATHNGAITREKKVLLTSLGKKLNQDASRVRNAITAALLRRQHANPA